METNFMIFELCMKSVIFIPLDKYINPQDKILVHKTDYPLRKNCRNLSNCKKIITNLIFISFKSYV